MFNRVLRVSGRHCPARFRCSFECHVPSPFSLVGQFEAAERTGLRLVFGQEPNDRNCGQIGDNLRGRAKLVGTGAR